ncbi:hypothetical protein GcC1_088021b [Golovinomyces cichoracearum]|uniref:Uncharacterized protein n=1 Tax=Golovinomyces cichoracearum TaxID=62708 RepID=A0A420IH08_9PEZI|nr:hypothetical protein GcC1_088021b [Golovinomyces cichoracearum]
MQTAKKLAIFAMDWVIMPGTVSSDTRQDDMVKAFDLRKSPKIVRRHPLRGLQFVPILEKSRI